MLRNISLMIATTVMSGTLLAADTSVIAPDDPAAYSGSRFAVKTEQIANDVYVMRRVATWRSFVQGNVTVIVNADDVVVVDSGSTAYTENVVAEIKKITDKPITTVITTHWHGDHNRGNHVYRKHYPDLRIISHAKTHENMWHRDKSLGKPRADDALEKARTRAAENVAKAVTDNLPEERIASARDYEAGIDELYADLDNAQSGIADVTFENKMVLHHGERTIELLHLGRANTDGDIVVWLPKEKIVATGDIVVRPTPYGFFSYPADWADTIENIKALEFATLVPGHGPVLKDNVYLDKLAHLFRDLT
ncbi:MAG: MBL fold metallo-hydrolase, partial [Kordiimonas sp.]